ncbi:MAG: succinate dehydrogenase assembly factor 2 [Pseudomonadota bacterium]
MTTETTGVESLRRVRWLCRRGTKELDVVLNRFVDQRFEHLSDTEKILFRQLLDMPDPVLQEWFFGERGSEEINVLRIKGMDSIVSQILSTTPD